MPAFHWATAQHPLARASAGYKETVYEPGETGTTSTRCLRVARYSICRSRRMAYIGLYGQPCHCNYSCTPVCLFLVHRLIDGLLLLDLNPVWYRIACHIHRHTASSPTPRGELPASNNDSSFSRTGPKSGGIHRHQRDCMFCLVILLAMRARPRGPQGARPRGREVRTRGARGSEVRAYEL